MRHKLLDYLLFCHTYRYSNMQRNLHSSHRSSSSRDSNFFRSFTFLSFLRNRCVCSWYYLRFYGNWTAMILWCLLDELIEWRGLYLVYRWLRRLFIYLLGNCLDHRKRDHREFWYDAVFRDQLRRTLWRHRWRWLHVACYFMRQRRGNYILLLILFRNWCELYHFIFIVIVQIMYLR